MTTRREGPTDWRRAALSQVEDVARRALVLTPPGSRTVRELAFHRYRRQVRRILRSAPVEFEVTERRPLAVGERSSVVELGLVTDAPVAPGDVLWLWWRNSEERVAAATGGLAPQGHWTTPLPHRPSRWRTAPEDVLWREVVDLSGEPANRPPVRPEPGDGSPRRSGSGDGFPAHAPTPLLRTAPRIVPRFFTTSDAAVRNGRTELRLQVTRDQRWPERAAAHLHRAEPGERLRGWVLPHPHRVPPGPGLVVVTGSGAAAVFAALRSGTRGVRLFWGLGDKELAPWVEAEVAAWLASGALLDLSIARTPTRVTDLLTAADLRRAAASDGWLFVSGNAAMAEQVDLMVGEALGASRRQAGHQGLRYIVSS